MHDFFNTIVIVVAILAFVWLRSTRNRNGDGNGNWGECQAGNVRYSGSPIVLCTNVLPGTTMGVTSTSGAGQSIQIED